MGAAFYHVWYTHGMYKRRKEGQKPRMVELYGDYTRDLRSGKVGYNFTMRVCRGVAALSTIDESAVMPQLTSTGLRVRREFEGTFLKLSNQGIWIKCAVFMPDHVHLCFWVDRPLKYSILYILARALVFSEKTLCAELGIEAIWQRPGHLFQCYSREVLEQKIAYNRGNVARWKMDHLTRTLSHPHLIRHPKLAAEFAWEGYGAVELLEEERFLPCYISSRASEDSVAHFTRLAVQLSRAGWTLVGGFVSPRERALLAEVRKTVEPQVIHLASTRLAESKIPAKLAEALSRRKFLRLTSAEGRETCTRELCVWQNLWAEAFCGDWKTAVEAHFSRQALNAKQLAYVHDFLTHWQTPHSAKYHGPRPLPTSPLAPLES